MTNDPAPPVRVLLIDSGIDATHPSLLGRVAAAFDVDSAGISDPVARAPSAEGYRNGHGTAMASVIASLAPTAEIVDITLLDHRNTASLGGLVTALDLAAELNCDIVNLSLGLRMADRGEITSRVSAIAGKGSLIVHPNGLVEGRNADTIPVVRGPWDDPFRVEEQAPGNGTLVARGAKTSCAWPGGRTSFAEGTSLSVATVSGLLAGLIASGISAQGAKQAREILLTGKHGGLASLQENSDSQI